MENVADIALVQKVVKAKTPEEEEVSSLSALVQKELVEVNSKNEGEEKVYVKATAVPVLTERNAENNITTANTTNKMVSPVLLKLRRNQEKRVNTANPVDPVQVPPKQFLGFPSERYMSPTDSIMSPISRGLLARSRRSKRLPPAFVPPKVLDHTFQDAELDNTRSS